MPPTRVMVAKISMKMPNWATSAQVISTTNRRGLIVPSRRRTTR